VVRGSSTPPSAPGAASAEIQPNLISLVSLAHTLCEAGRVHEAEEICRLILREQPGMAAAQAALGRVLFESGKLEGAEVWLELTARQTPGCFAAYRWLAEVLLQRGAHDRAYAVLAQAAVLAPDNPRVQQLLSRLSDAQALAAGSAPPPGEPIHITGPGRRPALPPAREVEVEVEVEVDEPIPRRPRTEEFPSWAYDDAVPVQRYSQASPLEGFPQSSSIRDYSAPPPLPRSAPSSSTSISRPMGEPSKRLWARASVRFAAGAFVVAGVLGLVFELVMWVGAERLPTPSASAVTASARPLQPASSESVARQQIEWAIRSGGIGELTAASQAAAPQLKSPQVLAAHAFAAALLASEYGIPVSAETRALADAVLSDERLRSELAAARALFAVAGGNLAAAARAGDGVRETPWLTFAMAKTRRLAGGAGIDDGRGGQTASAPGAGAGDAVGAAVVLQAEILLDQGDPVRAAEVLSGLLARAPTQARARLALAEARSALGSALGADEARDLRAACATDGPRSVVIEAGCALGGAEELRRKGQRLEARAGALKVATLAPPEPRLLARTAQLLLNLGETRRAEAMVVKARGYASPLYPPLAWALLGARINRGAQVDLAGAPTAGGPESRLLAVRAALAREGAAGVQKALMRMKPAQVNADPDLSWFAMLPRVQRPRTAVRVAQRYATERRPPPGPVGSYVLGLLARWGGQRPLAVRWLSQARAGHGDACSAVSLESALVTRLGRRSPRVATECDPRLAPDLAR
jgi:tetratricopeptide (TPR) repeat protein